MLQSLSIRNAALIESLELEFSQGLNILSGETGAGKSIIIDSVSFALGERPGKDFIRTGERLAEVEAFFCLENSEVSKAIREMGINIDEDGGLLIYRTQNEAGRGQIKLNGRNATVGMLKEIAALLIDIHGQHQHQSLLDANKHITLLDRFCGEELELLKAELAQIYADYRANNRELRGIIGGADREQQMEMLSYQIKEIEDLRLKEGEDEELSQRKHLLLSSERRSRHALAAFDALSAGKQGASALHRLAQALEELDSLREIDESVNEVYDSVSELQAALEDVAHDFRGYCGDIEFDPQELENIEDRLAEIHKLSRRYGGSVEDILVRLQELKQRLSQLEQSEVIFKRLSARKKELEREMLRVSGLLSESRKRAAGRLKGEITQALRELGMKAARFEVNIERRKEMSVNGFDKVEFLFSANAGEPVKPLAQVASGGEASRVMLALKSVLSQYDSIGTFIFDEIDAGVSGRTAQMVAEKLVAIAQSRQILCITHLPQIAAMGDRNFLIEKHAEGGRTISQTRVIEGEELAQELARLIGGVTITEATLRAARELRELAEQRKKA